MTSLEQILKVEKKARDHEYETTIIDGGRFFKCTKYAHSGRYTLEFQEENVIVWIPVQNKLKCDQFEDHIKEQQQLLELAKMLQSSEPKTSDYSPD